ncbi:hypothetical protein BDV33DRAFT_184982 [Aspergillus novoparasiticus]|uniref:Uncharacterized protein n=1 Tax=Aspergillus novoparasiticus TaxID=986946 RepID=A0A5N6E994_9EURO|nr:hypothetical protein BDV33DRAFT_184982 [Aspergillus novoparasiticus]
MPVTIDTGLPRLGRELFVSQAHLSQGPFLVSHLFLCVLSWIARGSVRRRHRATLLHRRRFPTSFERRPLLVGMGMTVVHLVCCVCEDKQAVISGKGHYLACGHESCAVCLS